MLRRLYVILLRLHPGAFRKRFEPEMLSIFDEARHTWSATSLIADAAGSLCMQWLFRGGEDMGRSPAPVPGSGPLFYTCPDDALPPRRLIAGALVAAVALAGITYILGHTKGPARRWLIGSHRQHRSQLFQVATAAPAEDLTFEVKLPPDPTVHSDEALRNFIRGYFRDVAVLEAIDTNHDQELSPTEIDNAPARLLTLDRDGDGALIAGECGQRRGWLPEARGFNPLDLAKAILAYDRNGDGQLQRSEVPRALQAFFEHADTDRNGVLSPGELLNEASAQVAAGRLPELESGTIAQARMSFMTMHPVLAALDANHDGILSADEIRNAAKALRTLDRNRDGKLTAFELMPDPVASWTSILFRLDSGGDGKISRAGRANEFGEHFRDLLDAADRDHDGSVTRAELAAEIRKRADLNRDGIVPWDEMLIALQTGLVRGRK